jgi:hypothetical protein
MPFLLPTVSRQQRCESAGNCQVFRPLLLSPADKRPRMYIWQNMHHSPSTTTNNTPPNHQPQQINKPFTTHVSAPPSLAVPDSPHTPLPRGDLSGRRPSCSYVHPIPRGGQDLRSVYGELTLVLRVQPDRALWLATFPAVSGPPAPASSSRRRQRVPTIGNQPPCAPTSRTSAALSGPSTPAHRTDVVLRRAV